MGIGRAGTVQSRERKLRTHAHPGLRQALLLVLALAPLALVSGCAGVVSGQGTKTTPQASFQVSPISLDFGSIVLGKKTSQSVSVTNTGNTSLAITQATVSSNQFSVSGISLPLSLAAGQAASFTVWFNGTVSGKVTGTLTVQGDNGTSPAVIALSGTATAAQPQLSVVPASLDFGSVTVGSKASSNITLSNAGTADLSVSVITVNGSLYGVSGIATPKTISAGQSATMTVTFSPVAAGLDNGSIVLTSNDPLSPTTIALSGTGSTAAVGHLTLNPTSLSFGNVSVGGNTVLSTTLTNSGQAAVHISQVTVTGPAFSESGLAAPATLNPGQSATLQVKCAPTSAGSTSGSVSIASDAPSSPLVLGLSGVGVQAGLSVSPASINFGSVVDGSSKTQLVTLTNTGAASLTIAQATVSGIGFSVSGLSTPLTIATGQSSTFNVQFAPQSAGPLNGSLSLVSNAPNSPTALSFSGTGVAASFTLSPAPSSVSFGSVTVGSSATQSVSVSNTGNSNVTISQINVSAKDVTVSGVSTPVTLAPAQSVAMTARFSPTSVETVTGNITVVNAQGANATVSVAGSGVQPGLSIIPASISFGNVVTGTTNSQTVQISNTGSASLTISQANLTGSGFATSGLSLPLTLAAGQGSTFNVQFAPQAAGAVSGSLSLVSNAPNSPSALALSGTGIAATYVLSVSSSNLNFGNVNTGSSATQSVTFTNTGNSNVQISQITESGAGFSLSGAGTPVTLSPSQTLAVTVHFSPSVAGSASGSITVTSNASGSPASISLSGTGVTPVQHSVALTWNASTSTVSGYNIYRSTVSGSGYTKVNSSLVGSLSYSDATVQSATTYYYVTTAVDASSNESAYSNEAQAIVP